MGFDLSELATDSRCIRRADALRWVDGLNTRPSKAHPEGYPRAKRLAACGALQVGRYPSGQWGVEHAWCRDRACPWCMKCKQARLAAAARAKVAECASNGRRVMFVTLTQMKLPGESATSAVARALDSWADLITVSRSGGRLLRHCFVGGLRSLEIVYSSKGARRHNGGRVAESGHHAHLHALMELAAPSFTRRRAILKGLSDQMHALRDRFRHAVATGQPAIAEHRLAKLMRMRRVKSMVRDAGTIEGWTDLARELLLLAWLEQNPEAARLAQCVELADVNRAGQVTKYVTKPFELRDTSLAREVFQALVNRKVVNGFGSWSQWATDAEEEKPEAVYTPTRTKLWHVVEAARSGLRSIEINFGQYTCAKDPLDILADLEKHPRTWSAMQRESKVRTGETTKRQRAKWEQDREETVLWLEKQGIPWSPRGRVNSRPMQTTYLIAGIRITFQYPDPMACDIPDAMVPKVLAALVMELADLRQRYDRDHGGGDEPGIILGPGN